MAKQHNHLTAALALALGVFATLALTPHEASGYPGGAVISLEANPVIAATPAMVGSIWRWSTSAAIGSSTCSRTGGWTRPERWI